MDEMCERKETENKNELFVVIYFCMYLLTLHHPSQRKCNVELEYLFTFSYFIKEYVTCCAHNLRRIAFYAMEKTF